MNQRLRQIATAIVFTVTIFLGAFLLFQVQPLIGRFLLPWFGGSPEVWTTCMLFFQVFLLAGYTYAHLLVRITPIKLQAILHIVALSLQTTHHLQDCQMFLGAVVFPADSQNHHHAFWVHFHH